MKEIHAQEIQLFLQANKIKHALPVYSKRKGNIRVEGILTAQQKEKIQKRFDEMNGFLSLITPVKMEFKENSEEQKTIITLTNLEEQNKLTRKVVDLYKNYHTRDLKQGVTVEVPEDKIEEVHNDIARVIHLLAVAGRISDGKAFELERSYTRFLFSGDFKRTRTQHRMP